MISVECLKPVKLSGFDAKTRSVLKKTAFIIGRVYRSEKKSVPEEISVRIVDKPMMQELHSEFMQDPTDTDVLSFPNEFGGDIAICAPVAIENATRFNEPVAREMLRLIVHGTLHLLGYKDEPDRERAEMWNRQERLVEDLWNP